MNVENMTGAQYGLLFDIRRSARYHDRRRAFFETLHRVTSALTILLSGGVLFELAGTGDVSIWMKLIGATAALPATFDMVAGYASAANRHAALRGRFIDLEAAILKGDDTPENWRDWQIARLQIERDEPPIYRALDLLCYNEQCRSEGARRPEGQPRLKLHQRLTCHFYPWSDMAIR